MAESFLDKLRQPSMDWLFLFVPLTLVLEDVAHVAAPLVFFSAALSILPARCWPTC